jgi:hypothetical protein
LQILEFFWLMMLKFRLPKELGANVCEKPLLELLPIQPIAREPKLPLHFLGKLLVGQTSDAALKNLNMDGPVIDPRLSPDGKYVAWSDGKDLFIVDFAGSNLRNLTNEKAENVSWGWRISLHQRNLVGCMATGGHQKATV